MAKDRRLFLVAQRLALAAEHGGDLIAAFGEQLLRGLRALEIVHHVDEIVLRDEPRAKAGQCGFRPIDDRPAHRLGALLELVALDERLPEPDEVVPEPQNGRASAIETTP